MERHPCGLGGEPKNQSHTKNESSIIVILDLMTDLGITKGAALIKGEPKEAPKAHALRKPRSYGFFTIFINLNGSNSIR